MGTEPGNALLSVLVDDPEESERRAPDLDDGALERIYRVLVLARVWDERMGRLRESGKLAFHVPGAEMSASAVGAAVALEEGDWLYPGNRDHGAFLVRGGSVRQLVAQALGTVGDLAKGRRLPGHPSLGEGRFVSPSPGLGARVQQAVGTAFGMRLRGTANVAVALCGAGAIGQPAFHSGLEAAARFEAPVVIVCRGSESRLVGTSARAEALGLAAGRADGGDALAVVKAVGEARARGIDGGGATVIEALVAPEQEGEDRPDAAARMESYLEHRGLWDPGKSAEIRERAERQIDEAVEAETAAGPPAPETLFEDVTAAEDWMRDEARESLGIAPDPATSGESTGRG